MLEQTETAVKPPSPRSPRSVRRVAMDCLARREHSFFELKQKLQTRLPEQDPDEIQRELERLRNENLQSDGRFAEAFVRYRKARGFGYLHIREDLRRRFVPESLIAQYLLADDPDWQSIADSLVARRLHRATGFSFGSSLHGRLSRYLQSRGFSSDVVRQTLEKYLQ